MFSYCTGIYRNCRDDKGLVEIIARVESALMTIGCFFAACRNGSSTHLFDHFQLDHHRGGILVTMPTGVLEDFGVTGLYDAIRLAVHGPELRLLVPRRLQKIDWSRYGSSDLPFFG